MRKFKANVFIVGSAKSGTTFLSEYFSQHSECCMAGIKEPDFFSHDLIAEKRLYYNTEAIKEEEAYHNLFDQTQHFRYYADASVSYLPYPEVAGRIYDYNPKARIIILLRNPVERAYSHYKMDLRLGVTSEDFSQVIRKKSKSPLAEQYYHQYVELGVYSAQVERYVSVFGKEQVLCMMVSDRQKMVDQALSFLSLDHEGIKLKERNAAISFRFSFLNRMYSNRVTRTFFKNIVPNGLVRWLKRKEPSLLEEDRQFLNQIYQADMYKLKKILEA